MISNVFAFPSSKPLCTISVHTYLPDHQRLAPHYTLYRADIRHTPAEHQSSSYQAWSWSTSHRSGILLRYEQGLSTLTHQSSSHFLFRTRKEPWHSLTTVLFSYNFCLASLLSQFDTARPGSSLSQQQQQQQQRDEYPQFVQISGS